MAGPRYTSYPPATKFSNALDWNQLAGHIEANNRSARDLSIYFHIPFCETLCWFCGCTTVITSNHDKGRDYINYLDREVARLAPLLNPGRKAVQLHFGGGSLACIASNTHDVPAEVIAGMSKRWEFQPAAWTQDVGGTQIRIRGK